MKSFCAIQRNTRITSKVGNNSLEDIKGITIAVITLVVIIKITIKVATVKANTLVEVARMEVAMINIKIRIDMKTTGMVDTIAETIMAIPRIIKASTESLINPDMEKKVARDMVTISMVANLATIRIVDHLTIITINTIQVKVDLTVAKGMITIAATTNRMIPQPRKDIVILINRTHSRHRTRKTLLPTVYLMHHSNNPTLIMDHINMHLQGQVQGKQQQQLATIQVTNSISNILQPISNNIPRSITSKEFKASQMDTHRITDNLLNLPKPV